MNEPTGLSRQVNQFHGSMLAMECLINALAESLSADQRRVVHALYASESAAFRTALMSSTAPEETIDAFERDVQRAMQLLGEAETPRLRQG